MTDLWWAANWCAHHCYDVKTEITIDAPGLDKVVNSQPQVLQLPIVNGFLWFSEHTVATGLDLHKDERLTIQGDDVEIAMPRLPVALHNDIVLPFQESRSQFLAPRPEFIMYRHNLFVFQCLSLQR